MAIVTDSTPFWKPKQETCNAFKLFQLLATPEQTEAMRQNYLKGGYGYGHAKTALFELIIEKYNEPRRIFTKFVSHPQNWKKN